MNVLKNSLKIAGRSLMTVTVIYALTYAYGARENYVPEFLRLSVSNETKVSLGCVDEEGAKLMDTYHTVADMAKEGSNDPVSQMLALKDMTNEAQAAIKTIQHCFQDALKSTPDLNHDAGLSNQIDTMTSAYEGIFLSQAVSISRQIRHGLGVGDKSTASTATSDDKQQLGVDFFVDHAELAYVRLSARIGNIALR